MFRNFRPLTTTLVLVLWTAAMLSPVVWGQTPAALPPGDCPPDSIQRTVTFTAGVNDAFRPPPEPASRSSQLSSLRPNWNNFDDAKAAYPVGHTFTELPCYIVGAELTLSLAPIGRSSGDEFIGLELNGSKFVWSSPIRSLNRFWPSPTTLILDLNQLPVDGSSLVSLLNQLKDGSLDVFLGEKMSVDYMSLRVTYCEFTDCNKNCIPDKQDIASGYSRDDNRNGIPDECETGGGDPASLNVLCDNYLSVGMGPDCCTWLVLSPAITTTGEVGAITVTNDYDPSQGGLLSACFPPGITQVTFIVTTASGLTAQCTTVIHVYDNAPPVITPR